ncbi:MAG: class II aldolase/adducin family protein [Armatimonadetes bacterium]|nr:class II aldolase/adducin family protein [Armatimonadota bacterium]
MSEINRISDELIKYSRLCYERGLVSAAGGNISIRVPDRDCILLTPSGYSLREIDRDCVLGLSSNGERVYGPAGLKPSKEWGMHLAIFNQRKDAAAVIHVHSPVATGFSVKGEEIPACTASFELKLKRAPLVEYAPPGSAELAGYVAEAIRQYGDIAKAFLLKKHGVLAFGGSIGETFDTVELVEETAKIALVSRLLCMQG